MACRYRSPCSHRSAIATSSINPRAKMSQDGTLRRQSAIAVLTLLDDSFGGSLYLRHATRYLDPMPIDRLIKSAAWLSLVAILFVTICPIDLRPHTMTEVGSDRAGAFAVMAPLRQRLSATLEGNRHPARAVGTGLGIASVILDPACPLRRRAGKSRRRARRSHGCTHTFPFGDVFIEANAAGRRRCRQPRRCTCP